MVSLVVYGCSGKYECGLVECSGKVWFGRVRVIW